MLSEVRFLHAPLSLLIFLQYSLLFRLITSTEHVLHATRWICCTYSWIRIVWAVQLACDLFSALKCISKLNHYWSSQSVVNKNKNALVGILGNVSAIRRLVLRNSTRMSPDPSVVPLLPRLPEWTRFYFTWMRYHANVLIQMNFLSIN